MNVLVIGGAGFIGSNLISELLDLGNYVVSLDNYLIGTKANHNEGAEYVFGCAGMLPNLDYDADIVFHLGEYSRVEKSDLEPWICLKNTYATLPSVLEYCQKKNAKLIYSGSSTKFSQATNPYILAKKLNTQLVRGICDQYGIDYAITYFYNVYGDNEIAQGPYATVIAKFLKAKQEDKTVLVTGDGTQRRHFTHVNDIVSGLIMVADEGHGDEYGIGSDESFSILELVQMIGVSYQLTNDKPSNRKDSSLMTGKTIDLGWQAKHRLADYIGEKLRG